ncbi:MAG: biopolymer transporter ExbD [Gammaproteobacteria bacterium]|nr:biopolymer transporter ExbD [Gammaproteobacteria bacterium]
MNFRKKQDEALDVNITPLIDVVFLLLIFFMIATTFKKDAQIEIDLPKATGQQVKKQGFEVEISIDSLGRYFVNNRRLRDSKIETLKLAIKQTVGDNKNPHIIINSDKDTTYQSVMTAMDAVRQSGMNRFSLTVKQPTPEK